MSDILKYGDHTKECATRHYHENQWGGFHSYMGKPCDCGWDQVKGTAERSFIRFGLPPPYQVDRMTYTYSKED